MIFIINDYISRSRELVDIDILEPFKRRDSSVATWSENSTKNFFNPSRDSWDWAGIDINLSTIRVPRFIKPSYERIPC